MNKAAMSSALNRLSGRLDSLAEVPTGQSRDVKDAAECLQVLRRVVEGKPIDKAFGAPGDWGYGTPIGDALAGRPSPSPPAFREEDCGGVFDGNQVISDADPGL